MCRKAEGASYNEVEFADLPSKRVNEDPPFTHVGLDFAGPLYVLDELSKTREPVKVYIVYLRLDLSCTFRTNSLVMCRSVFVGI